MGILTSTSTGRELAAREHIIDMMTDFLVRENKNTPHINALSTMKFIYKDGSSQYMTLFLLYFLKADNQRQMVADGIMNLAGKRTDIDWPAIEEWTRINIEFFTQDDINN